MKNRSLFTIFLYILFFTVIPPEYFNLNSTFVSIMKISQIFLFAFCFIFYFIYIMKHGLKKIIFLICLFWMIFIISTMINHNGSITTAIKPFMLTFMLCSTFDLFKYDKYQFLKVLSTYLKILIYINFITVLLFPNGLYKVDLNVNPHYFLGHRNNSIEFILPAICSQLLVNYLDNRNDFWHRWPLFIVSFLTILFTWSANAIVVMFFLLISLFLPTKKIITKFVNCFNFFMLYLIACYSVIVLRLQNYFEWFIVGILHKSLDFTDRIYIWDKAISWIKKSPIYGYGYENTDLKKLKISHSNSCHNYMLDFLYMGGILIVIVLFIMLFSVFKKLKKNKTLASNILTYSICGYFILWFATPIHLNILCLNFLIFMIADDVENIPNYKNDYFRKKIKV